MQEDSTWKQTTFVTSLININREHFDGRSFLEYISWFLQTITIPAPMIIYVEPSLEKLVKLIRKSYPTQIILQNQLSIPLGWSLPFVQDTLKSENFKKKMKYPNDLTNKCPGYAIVTNSKYAWLLNAIESNPFETDLFFWIDGGLSRFWNLINPLEKEPSLQMLNELRNTKEIFTLLGRGRENLVEEIFKGKRFSPDELIGQNMNIIMTGFFGGHRDSILHLCKKMLQIYSSEMILKHRIDHDQTAIILHFQENPGMYRICAAHPQLDAVNFLIFSRPDIFQK